MGLLVAHFAQDQINIDEHEVFQKFDNFNMTLSTSDATEKCILDVTDHSLHISPYKCMGDEIGDFKIDINSSRSAEDWAKIAMVFIKDILWIGKNEIAFEVYDIESELIHDTFTTKSLIHAMHKTQHLYTLRGLDTDDIEEVLIIMDNEECESREFRFKPQDKFFSMVDRSIKNDDLILILFYINSLKNDTGYCHRANLKLGVEV